MSSLLHPELHKQSTLIPLTTGWTIGSVRDALRSCDQTRINRAVTPLYEKCVLPLERFADGLVRRGESVGMGVGKDGEDIAIEAFDKVFTLLVGESGDRIRDELHLLRILFRAARCVWIDSLRLPDVRHSLPESDLSHAAGDAAVSPGSDPSELLFGAGKTALVALRLLFTDGDRLARLLRQSGAGLRHYRQYQALALYELGERLRDDLEDATAGAESVIVRFWRQLSVEKICIRQQDWLRVETASGMCISEHLDPQTHLYELIRAAVETVCGANLQNRVKRHILRHEMGRLLTECGAEIERLGGV